MAALAERIARRAHAGQYDKAGQPYLEHVRRVSRYVDPSDPHAVAAAWLHDTLEDSPITTDELVAEGIPAEVIEAVELLTRTPGQPSSDYYAKIRAHPLARQVKLADLADNTDPERLALLPEPQRTRLITKYTHAYHALAADTQDGHHRRAAHRSNVQS